MAVSVISTDEPVDVGRAVGLLGGMGRFVDAGDRVLIKPNLCAARTSESGAVSDPRIVAEICSLVKEVGGDPFVADSPIYPYPSKRVFREAGYSDFEREYGFPMVDLNGVESVRVAVPQGEVIEHIEVALPVLECDRLINVPVMKTHIQTTVSLGLKNLKGVVPGRQKHLIHLRGLDRGIVDLNTLVGTDLTIVDGIHAMEGTNAPVHGNPIEMDVIIAGDNVVETDATAATVMGLDPRRVDHLRMAEEAGLGRLAGFDTLGDDPRGLARSFDIPRRPALNRAIISGIMVRAWNLFGGLAARITGGERVEGRVRLGELVIDEEKCDGCRLCIPACPVDALSFEEGLACDRKACILCFCCVEACPRGALTRRE